MKVVCILLLAGLAMVATHSPSHAQEWYGMATWNISIPDGDTKEFVDETSFRGFGLDFRKQFRPNTTIGIMGSWEVFHERTSESFTIGSATVTGSQDRYINSFPIMLGLHRYFGNEGGTRPYIGINGGGFILIQTLRIGLAEWEEDSWVWGAMPEAGLVIPLQSGAALIANARYSWALTGEDLNGEDRELTYWGIRVGFVWEQY
jgi:outer membrane protein